MSKRKRLVLLLLAVGIYFLLPESGMVSEVYAAEGQASENLAGGEAGVSALPEVTVNRGWVQAEDGWLFYQEDGSLLRESLAPDGHYVDIEGKWRPRTITLLDESFVLPDTFQSSDGRGSLLNNMAALEKLNARILKLIGEERLFYVYDDSIEYRKDDSSAQGTFLMGLYKNPANGSWRLKLSCRLNKAANRTAGETCDYAVFRYFLAQITHVPERVSEAIYDSWQGNNTYGINLLTPVAVGDVALTYTVENGSGVYILEDGMRYRQ